MRLSTSSGQREPFIAHRSSHIVLSLLALLLLATTQTFAQVGGSDGGAHYLIITKDAFVDALQPLAQWKTLKGMSAKIVPLSQIGGDSADIQTYIRNAWNNWAIKPEYVLVVGSPDLLPASRGGTDDGYGELTASYLTQLPVGRFFASTAAECSTLVAKTLLYEKNPFASGDTSWLLKGMTIVREDDPPDEYYQPDARYIRDLWQNAGFPVTESLSSLNNDSSLEVRNGINDGRGFVVYRGEGVGSWWTPFDRVAPATLTNRDRLPILVSGSCQSLTLFPGQSMYADQFVRSGSAANPTGTVAFFGTTAVGSVLSYERGIVTRGFFTALFTEGYSKLGDACVRAKFVLDSLVHNQARYDEWNLLGDPELPVWTEEPRPLAVTYDTVRQAGSSTFTVKVARAGLPLPNALVCLMMDTSEYDTAYTNGQGVANLAICPLHTGAMSVTVTGRNSLPFQGSTRIISPAAPWLAILRVRVDDSQGGNGDGILNPGETIRLWVSLTNIGSKGALGVGATLTANDKWSKVSDSLSSYGDVVAHDSAVPLQAFTFSVDQGCTTGLGISFTLRMRDRYGTTWSGVIVLPVAAGRMAWTRTMVLGGNGDGLLTPGEGSRLMVILHNTGDATLHHVQAALHTNNSQVIITDSTSWFGDILPDSSANDSSDLFAVTAGPDLGSLPAQFTMTVKGDGGSYQYGISLPFSVRTCSPSGAIGPDRYGYYCYDDLDSASGRAPVFSWLELTDAGVGETIPGVSHTHNGLATLPLPFRFRYYGANWDTITVAANGFLAFGRTQQYGGANVPIPSDSAPQRNIMPMWDDLNSDTNGHGTILQYYDTTNHRWIEEFYQIEHTSNSAFWETFQVILLDPAYYATPTGDGEILFEYLSTSDAKEATIGIQDNTMTRGIQYACQGVYDPNAIPIANWRAIRFTTLAPVRAHQAWLTIAGVGVQDSTGKPGYVPTPGDPFRIVLSLNNTGETLALSVRGVLQSADSNSTVSDSIANFGNIAPHGHAANDNPYVVRVAGHPSDSIAHFAVQLNAGGVLSTLYFTLPLAGVTGIASPFTLHPSPFALTSFPNPARGSAHVRFGLPRTAKVDLSIYDAVGRCVRTLLRDQAASGVHELSWNGTDNQGRSVPGGVYFCRIQQLDGNHPQQLINKIDIIR